MKRIIAMILTLPWAVKASNQAFSFVTSSLFTMVLSPTFERLDVDTSTLVENAIKLSLLSSSSTSSNFESLFDIDIVLQQVEWADNTIEGGDGSAPSTTFRFEANAKFHEDPLTSSPPTQFALDSLVVRTFSQPSSKSGFLDDLKLLEAAGLNTVDSIEIALANAITEEKIEPQSNSLSLLDIVLISASGVVFLGIIYIMCQHHKDQADLADQQVRSLREWQSKRKVSTSSQGPEGIPCDVNGMQETGLSLKRDRTRVEGHDIEESPQRPMVQENIAYTGDSNEDGNEDENEDDPGIDHHLTPSNTDGPSSSTPPISNGSSITSSPVGRASSMGSSRLSVLSSADNNSNCGSPYRLGAPPPLYPMVDESSVGSFEASPLTARLLRLPMLDSPESSRRSATSPASAPAVLMGNMVKPDSSKVKDYFSARSTCSGRDLARPSSPRISSSDSRESTTDITDLAVASCRTLLSENHAFEKDWDVAKRRAIEEEDEEDVFCVDVDAHSNAEDVRSRMSGLSAVSEWMKSVRVIGSPGTKTSDTSHTSAEHSSVEPKSVQTKDATSMDGSLERSLAPSIAGI
jgi:hypothetical protein